MKNTLYTIFRIKAVSVSNTFLYFLQKIPILGKIFTDSLYSNTEAKVAFSFIISLFVLAWKFIEKALILSLLVVLPAIFLSLFKNNFSNFPSTQDITIYSGYIFFILYCFVTPILKSITLETTSEKYIGIKFLRIPPKQYVSAIVPIQILYYIFVYFLLLFVLGIISNHIGFVLGLVLCLLFAQFTGEAFALFVFDKTGICMQEKQLFSFSIIFIGLGVAYGVPVFINPSFINRLVSLPLLLLQACIGLLAAIYLFRYPAYNRKLPLLLSAEKALEKKKTRATRNRVQFDAVKMKDSDLHIQDTQSSSLDKKHGYDYFNTLFFIRHRRLLFKPVLIRISIFCAIFLICLANLIFFPTISKPLFMEIPRLLPVVVFISYLINTGEKSCKAMFYNCDIAMLRYGFYRAPAAILKNFFIRLRYVCWHNILINATMAGMMLTLFLLAGGSIGTDILLFISSTMILAIFFSIHHLFAYYVFQPYTTDLAIKNPIFKLLNGAVYVISYICMQISSAGRLFVIGVFVSTILYSVIALLMVYKYSPQKFRVK